MAETTYYGRPLSRQEIVFVNAYMDNYNLEQRARIKRAAEIAGCSAATFNHDGVQKEIAEREKKIAERNVATATEIMEFWTSVMRGKELDAFGLDAPLDVRLKASDSLAKRLIDNKEVDKEFTVKLIRD